MVGSVQHSFRARGSLLWGLEAAEGVGHDVALQVVKDAKQLDPSVALRLMPLASAFLLDSLKQLCEASLLRVLDRGVRHRLPLTRLDVDRLA